MELKNKTILITGGGTGLGLCYAKALNTDGNTIIICGRRQAKLDEAAAASPGLITIQCDIADDASVDAMFTTIDSEHGGIDVLFNNAGVYYGYDIAKVDDAAERIEKEIQINLIAPLKLIARTLPKLEARSGAIVNISSGLAYVPFAPAPVYSATKAAMHFFSRNLRRQLENSKVKVIEILPPVIDTEMVAGVDIPKMDPEKAAAQSLEAIRKGKEEILVGQAKQLRFMSRVAPGFIEDQISKGAP